MSDSFPKPRMVETNGIKLAVYEAGSGSPVIFLHGFPELAYSWRFQLPALAEAGFHAIAPDLRGYGYSEAPDGVDAYRIEELIADIHGLLDSFELEQATFVGHDWGALILWQMGLLAPERIERQIILNIPFYPAPDEDPIDRARSHMGDDFYIVNFQESDEADRTFALNPGHFIDVMMRKNQITRERFEQLPKEMKSMNMLAAVARKESAGEPLLTDTERNYFAAAFRHSGFTGPINYYRNWSYNWTRIKDLEQKIRIPTLFIGAVDDVLIMPEHINNMSAYVDDLQTHMIDDCGHWTQQEHPDTVNRLIIDWLSQ